MSVVNHSELAWRESRPGSRLRLIVDPTGGVAGLALLEQECAPGVGAPSHYHDFEEVLTVAEGVAEVWCGDVRQTVNSGTTIFVPTGVVHGFRNAGDVTLKLDIVIAALELRQTFVVPPEAR